MRILLTIMTIALLSGCALTSKPPTKLEQKLYSIQTNQEPNGVSYTLVPSPEALKLIEETGGGIGSIFGVGGLTAGALGALYALWAQVRNRKKSVK